MAGNVFTVWRYEQLRSWCLTGQNSSPHPVQTLQQSKEQDRGEHKELRTFTFQQVPPWALSFCILTLDNSLSSFRKRNRNDVIVHADLIPNDWQEQNNSHQNRRTPLLSGHSRPERAKSEWWWSWAWGTGRSLLPTWSFWCPACWLRPALTHFAAPVTPRGSWVKSKQLLTMSKLTTQTHT